MKQEKDIHKQKMYHLLTTWRYSEMSLRAFSKLHGISYERLRYWRKKLKIFKKDIKEKIDTPDFIPIEISNTVAEITYLELTFPNNVKLNVTSGITIDSLKKIIKLF